MATEISLTIDWGIMLPTLIATASLILTAWSLWRKRKREDYQDLEKKVDDALSSLKESKEELLIIGHEKDELRRENVALLAQIAKMAKKNGSPDDGGSK